MTTDANPFRAAEHVTECSKCGTEYGWNTEDGLAGQACQCGYEFTEADFDLTCKCGPNGTDCGTDCQCACHDVTEGQATMGDRSGVPLAEQHIRHCALCDKSGPEEMFEKFNRSGGLACKSTTLCQLRQQGTDPAALLGQLVREMTRAEMHGLTARELAELDYDVNGPRPRQGLDGFAGALSVHLSSKGDSGQAVAATEADRAARKRRRAALRAADTRRGWRAAPHPEMV
jgi:hypothetical protein